MITYHIHINHFIVNTTWKLSKWQIFTWHRGNEHSHWCHYFWFLVTTFNYAHPHHVSPVFMIPIFPALSNECKETQ